MMSFFNRTINRITFIVVTALFCAVICFSVIAQANYSFEDYPYFSFNTIYVYISTAIFFLFLIVFIVLTRKIRYVWPIFVVFCILSIITLLLIPMEPYSDMGMVYDSAANGFYDNIDYLQKNGNLHAFIVFLSGLLIVFSKSIWVPKIFNLICATITLFFTWKIYELLHSKRNSSTNKIGDSKQVLLMSVLIIPVYLYNNNIYNDVMAVTLSVAVIYFVLRNQYNIGYIITIVILSTVLYFVRQSGIIIIIATFLYILLEQKQVKMSLLYGVIVILLIGILSFVISTFIDIDTSESPNVWSFIQMGINESEFGFQDGSHSSQWTFMDCVNKYKELGFLNVLSIWGKKIIWMWSEGTFQAERYGMGGPGTSYLYDTVVVNDIIDVDNSVIRMVINRIMKSQYFVYIVLAVVGIIKNRKNKGHSYLRLIVVGFFVFYIFWEIKSRYIFSLYPIIAIFACDGLIELLKLGKFSRV